MPNTWHDLIKMPLAYNIDVLYSQSLEKYVSVDNLIEDLGIEEMDIDVPESQWPEYFELIICEVSSPSEWRVRDSFPEFLGEDDFGRPIPPPEGWEAIEKTVNEWIQGNAPWGWRTTAFAWNGTYVRTEEEGSVEALSF